MTTPELLMCAPDHFNVTYQINPWMKPDDWAAHESEWYGDAGRQWAELRATLERLGVRIREIAPGKGWPDMVFTANAGIELDGRVLLARFRHPERQGEEPLFEAWFRKAVEDGWLKELELMPEGMIQEGEGDCLWDRTRNLFWAGYGQRSAEPANACIADFFGREVVGLELVNPFYYHIDVCMCPLPSGHIVYLPEAFSTESQARISDRAGAEYLVPVTTQDADRMALNAVPIGDTIVVNDCLPETEARLNEIGYSVIRVPLPAFLKAGGSACCLSMRLDNRSS